MENTPAVRQKITEMAHKLSRVATELDEACNGEAPDETRGGTELREAYEEVYSAMGRLYNLVVDMKTDAGVPLDQQ